VKRKRRRPVNVEVYGKRYSAANPLAISPGALIALLGGTALAVGVAVWWLTRPATTPSAMSPTGTLPPTGLGAFPSDHDVANVYIRTVERLLR